MATAPVTSSVATNSPCVRLPSMPLRRAPATISFSSHRTRPFLPKFLNNHCPAYLDLFLLFLLRAAWPAALISCIGLSRRSDVVAAAGHQKLMGSLTSNEGLRFGVVSWALLNRETPIPLLYNWWNIDGTLVNKNHRLLIRFSLKKQSLSCTSTPFTSECTIQWLYGCVFNCRLWHGSMRSWQICYCRVLLKLSSDTLLKQKI